MVVADGPDEAELTVSEDDARFFDRLTVVSDVRIHCEGDTKLTVLLQAADATLKTGAKMAAGIPSERPTALLITCRVSDAIVE